MRERAREEAAEMSDQPGTTGHDEEAADPAAPELPTAPPAPEGELSDELLEQELERIAAGSNWWGGNW
jgi:hypothetical protein